MRAEEGRISERKRERAGEHYFHYLRIELKKGEVEKTKRKINKKVDEEITKKKLRRENKSKNENEKDKDENRKEGENQQKKRN